MEVILMPQAEEDINSWLKAGKKPLVKKIAQLIEAIVKDPFSGIGKPEPLKHDLSGAWSRRIDREHRLVYEVDKDKVFILSARGHY